MTSLLIAGRAACGAPAPDGPVVALHDWLQGHWALVFSDPDDFAPHASTPQGFMTCLADELRRARTKPLAVLNRWHSGLAASWLQHATSDRSLIVLEPASHEPVIDFSTRALALKLARLQPPYVLILDEQARCRSTLCYRPRGIDRARTVEELLRVVAALRGDTASTKPLPSSAPRARVTP
jgi:hypothetical protein